MHRVALRRIKANPTNDNDHIGFAALISIFLRQVKRHENAARRHPSCILGGRVGRGAAGGKPYVTGVRIQNFLHVKEGTGKSEQEFILDFVAAKKKEATRVLKTCREQDQDLFTRICLETEEGRFHILYSLFWGSKGMDLAVVSTAGTTNELWETYSPTFRKMSAFEIIDMTRFDH